MPVHGRIGRVGNQRIIKVVGVLALVLMGSYAIAGDISYSNGTQNPKTDVSKPTGAVNTKADVSITTFSFFGAPPAYQVPKPPKKHKKHKRQKKQKGWWHLG